MEKVVGRSCHEDVRDSSEELFPNLFFGGFCLLFIIVGFQHVCGFVFSFFFFVNVILLKVDA